jgi:MoaA/NifB/PqqE/SkfB family radical SAM enzyme
VRNAKVIVKENELYIEPISSCNLRCRMCYTNVKNGREAKMIKKEDIISFVDRFADFHKKEFSIYWCGTGEIFLHPNFPETINYLNEKHKAISHTIMTNGTLGRLGEINEMKNITFTVSIDGPETQHEWNRGPGNYQKTINFCKKAYALGCKGIEVRTLVTIENVTKLRDFEKELKKEINPGIELALILPYTNKELASTKSHGLITQKDIDDSRLLKREEMRKIVSEKCGDDFAKKIENPGIEDFSIYLSLNPDGVYNCCDGIIKIGEISTDMKELHDNLRKSKGRCYTCPFAEYC